MSFFKFLVDQKKVSPELLLKALIHQQTHSPTLLECLADHPKCSPDDLLQLVAYAQEKHLDLKSSQEKMGVIDESIFSQAIKKYSDKLLPIGRICAELSFISVSEYENLLKEFQDYRPAQGDEMVSSPGPEEKTQESAEPEISEAALESLRELGIMDDSLVSGEKKK